MCRNHCNFDLAEFIKKNPSKVIFCLFIPAAFAFLGYAVTEFLTVDSASKSAYASVISGVGALIAAMVAYTGLEKQLISQRQQRAIQILQDQHSHYLKLHRTASVLFSDIGALKKTIRKYAISRKFLCQGNFRSH
jgi:hypothetical protein